MSLLPYSIPLTAASGMWEYLPRLDASATGGWNASYTGSSAWPTSGASNVGVGSLYFRTQLSGASAGVSFFGTSILLCLGDHGATYRVSLDGANFAPNAMTNDPQCASLGAAVTVSITELEFKSHAITLFVQNATAASEFQLFGAVIGTIISVNGAEDTVKEKIIDDQDPGWVMLRLRGAGWDTPETDVKNYQGTGSFTCNYNTGSYSEASHTFSGASAVALIAPVTKSTHAYSVILDGETFSSDNSVSGWNIPQTVTFFRAGLDPNKLYTINLRNWSDDLKDCSLAGTRNCCQAIDGLKLYGSAEVLFGVTTTRGESNATSSTGSASMVTQTSSAPTTTPGIQDTKSTNHVPALAGGVVGGLLGCLLISALAVFFFRRLRQRNMPRDNSSPTAMDLPPNPSQYEQHRVSTRKTLWSDAVLSDKSRHSDRVLPPHMAYFPTSSYGTTSRPDTSSNGDVVLSMGASQRLSMRAQQMDHRGSVLPINEILPPAYQQ